MMRNCGRYWVLLIGLCVVLMGVIGCGSEEKDEDVVWPIVRIEAEGVIGSGVVFEKKEDRLVVLTAGHVVQGMPEKVEVVLQGNEQIESVSYVVSQASDVAFITIPVDAVSTELWQEIPVAVWDKDRFDGLSGGEQMTLQGFLENGSSQELVCDLIYPWIYTEDFAQYMMLLRGEILPGMSGGGVFDEAGNLVGILCGVSEEREIAVLPLSIILAEYSLVYG